MEILDPLATHIIRDLLMFEMGHEAITRTGFTACLSLEAIALPFGWTWQPPSRMRSVRIMTSCFGMLTNRVEVMQYGRVSRDMHGNGSARALQHCLDANAVR